MTMLQQYQSKNQHQVNKRYKKQVKKLQTRLNEEQRDAKRLTMLLELCKSQMSDGMSVYN